MSRLEFAKGNEAAYAVCRRRNILDKVCKNMKPKGGNYTKKECAEAAKKYKYKNDFINNHKILYQWAYNKGWLTDICKHMPKYFKKSILTG